MLNLEAGLLHIRDFRNTFFLRLLWEVEGKSNVSSDGLHRYKVSSYRSDRKALFDFGGRPYSFWRFSKAREA